METLHHSEQERQTREIIEQLTAPTPVVIGIEGGPCGGKTTLVERVTAEANGRQVVVVPEAASQHILALADHGIAFSELEHGNRQLYIETEAKILSSIVNNIDTAVAQYTGTDAIIIADRCDIAAYVEPDEYMAILDKIGLAEPPMYSRIDQMYYLPTVARINQSLYESLKATNPARYESAQRAVEICIRNQAAVADHPELHVGWGDNFADTISKLSRAVLQPEDESEVKLKPIDSSEMPRFVRDSEHLSQHAITQTYHEFDGQVFRLRKTLTEEGSELYSFTIKTGEGIKRTELQRRLPADVYNHLRSTNIVGEPLVKQRHHLLQQRNGDQMRLWAADRYHDRRLEEWTIETGVQDELEAQQIAESMPGYEQAPLSAEKLARLLGKNALR